MLDPAPLCPVLSAHARSLATTAGRGLALLARLDDETGNRPPAPGAWSPLQAIEHLNVSHDEYRPHMLGAIEGAPAGAAPYQQRTLLGRFLLYGLDPTRTMRVKAPKVFRPREERLDHATVERRFREHHEEWQRLLRRADGLDCGRAKLATPVSRWFKLTLAEAFTVHDWHEARHLGQAERAAGLG